MKLATQGFALIDPITLETGLFKVKPARCETRPFEAVIERGNSSYRYTAPDHLDQVDLTVLLAVLALAGQAKDIRRKPTDDGDEILWQRLRLSCPDGAPQLKIWQGRLADIAREAGMSIAGSTTALVRRRLDALASVQVDITRKNPATISSYRLLGFIENREEQVVRIALCPLLTGPLLFKERAQYSYICMNRYRALQKPASRIMHAVLSNRIRHTAQVPSCYNLTTLVGLVYRGEAPTPAAKRKRLSTVQAAIAELSKQGWSINRAGPAHAAPMKIWHYANPAADKAQLVVKQLQPGGQLPACSSHIQNQRITAQPSTQERI